MSQSESDQEPKLEIKVPGAIVRRVVHPFKPPVRRRTVELNFPDEPDSKKCQNEAVTAGARKERGNCGGRNEPGPSGVTSSTAKFSKVAKTETTSASREPVSSQEDTAK